jgi:hypothetical protein
LESPVPTGGYATADTRRGALARVIQENAELVRSGGELEILDLPEEYQDFGEDNNWVQREVEV